MVAPRVRRLVRAVGPVHRFGRAARLRLAQSRNRRFVARKAGDRPAPPSCTFFVIAQARTGSYLFSSLLDSHPEVACGDEVLNPDFRVGLPPGPHPIGTVRRHLRNSVWSLDAPVVGAKLLVGHFQVAGYPPEMLVADFPAARLFVLYRRNVFEQFVSLKRAQALGRWKTRGDQGREPPHRLRIDPAEFEVFADQKLANLQRLLQVRKIRERAEVLAYEDFSTRPQEIFASRVFPRLGVVSLPVQTQLRRTRQHHLESVVENYREVEDLARWEIQDIGL